MYFYLDIETAYTTDEAKRQEIASRIKPPGSMSKPETIAKWEAEKKPQAIREALEETALTGEFGFITTIGYAIDDGPIDVSMWGDMESAIPKHPTETQLLEAFARIKQPEGPVVFVGHSIDFDLRFIWQRAIARQVRMPAWMPRDWKAWGSNIFDTMHAWAGVKGHISAERLRAILGIHTNDPMTGKDAPLAWHERNYADLDYHCHEDIRTLRLTHQAMKKAGL